MRFQFNPFSDKLDISGMGPNATTAEFLTGNDGVPVPSDLGYNINVFGDNTTGINTTGDIPSNTLTLHGLASSTTQVGTTRYATNLEASAQSSTTIALSASNITSLFSVHYLPSSQGGTGLSSPAAHSLIVTNGSSPYTSLGVASNGQIPIGSIASDPVLNTITAGTNIDVTNGPGTITISGGINSFPVTPYVVGPVGQAGYQTIQAGINAAHAAGGGIVAVQPGNYTENLTLYDACHVTGITFADAGGGVNITGVHTPPTSGGFVFNNVRLISATDIFNSAAAGTAHLVMGNAEIFVTNGYTFNLPNWTGKLESFDVNAAVGTNDGYVNNTGGAEVDLFECSIGSGTSNTMNVSGFTLGAGANLYCPVNIQGGTTVFDYSVFSKNVTLSGTSTGTFSTCHFSTGSSAALTMSSSAAFNLDECVIESSNNPAITGAGAGTLTLNNSTFTSNTSLSGSLTVVNGGLTDIGSIRSNFTNHGLLLGRGTRGTLGATGTGSSGQVLQSGGASADPAYTTATYPSTTTINQLLYSSSNNTITGLSTANNSVLTTGATGTPVLTSLAADGQVIIGSTSGSPAAATLSAGSGISITNASNSITITATGAGFAWNSISASQTLAKENGYFCTSGGALSLALPTTSSIGDSIKVILDGSTSWTITQPNAGSIIRIGNSQTTLGTGGSISSTSQGDCIELVCETSNAKWVVTSCIGNITVV